MGMFDDLNKKYVEARKAQDKFVSGVLNLIISDLKYEKINKQKDLEDADVLSYLNKTVKTKKEAIAEYEKAGRADLVEKEQRDVEYIATLMPKALTEAEIKEIIVAAKNEIGASGAADTGKLMKEAMARLKGRADGNVVKTIVAEVLKG